MERLERENPSLKLNEEQKAEIAEIESKAKAKTAERELFLNEQIAKAHAAGQLGEAAAIEKQKISELRRIAEEAEEKKERVRRR